MIIKMIEMIIIDRLVIKDILSATPSTCSFWASSYSASD
jgi:hypothetical protein